MKNILVTGANGFVGGYLVDLLSQNNENKIFGLDHQISTASHDWLTSIEGDITDAQAMQKVVDKVQPDIVFHLAAVASVRESFENPQKTFQVNFFGTKNLLDALKASQLNPVVVSIGSSEEYGLIKADEVPVKESQAFRPMSPYAISKISAEMLGFQYCLTYQMKVIMLRPFTHTGPKQRDLFVLSNWCKQAVEIEKGKKENVIQVGNIESTRDFLDVRDVVKVYELASSKCQPGEAYNVCSGQGLKLEEILEMLKKISGQDFEIVKSPDLVRKVDVPILVGDNTKIAQATGWQPAITLEKTLEDMLDYWRKKV